MVVAFDLVDSAQGFGAQRRGVGGDGRFASPLRVGGPGVEGDHHRSQVRELLLPGGGAVGGDGGQGVVEGSSRHPVSVGLAAPSVCALLHSAEPPGRPTLHARKRSRVRRRDTTPMPPQTPAAALVMTSDLVDEVRWTEWKARGRADRLQTARRMRVVAALVALGLAGWLTAAIRAIE